MSRLIDLDVQNLMFVSLIGSFLHLKNVLLFYIHEERDNYLGFSFSFRVLNVSSFVLFFSSVYLLAEVAVHRRAIQSATPNFPLCLNHN